VLTALRDGAVKEVTLDFNTSAKKGRPFAQILYTKK
jgi:hypothetical protein